MDLPGFQRRSTAPWFVILCTALLALAALPGTATALTPDPTSNYAVQIPAICTTAPTSPPCTQAGVAELDAARAWEGQQPYRLPADFLTLSGAHQIVVLTNLDRQVNGLRTVPGTTAALDRIALQGAEAWTDPIIRSPNLSWAANWAGDFPAAVWAYATWMYDDGYGGPNIDCQAPGDSGCWGHRDDILARFAPGGTLEMGAAEAGGDSYAMVIAQCPAPAQIHYEFRFSQA